MQCGAFNLLTVWQSDNLWVACKSLLCIIQYAVLKQDIWCMTLVSFVLIETPIDFNTISELNSRSEQTFEYTPPEALLNSSWFQGSKSARLKYVHVPTCFTFTKNQLHWISHLVIYNFTGMICGVLVLSCWSW